MIEKMLAAAAAAAPGRTAMTLCELESGRVLFQFNPTLTMPSASTIKTAVMAEVMRRIDAGILDPRRPVAVPAEAKLEDSILGLLAADSCLLIDLVTLMIVVSDNTATNVLIDLTTMDAVNAGCAALGLPATRLRRKMLDFEAARAGLDNTTSAADLARLFRLIGRRELPGSDTMLSILLHQKQGAFRRRLGDAPKIAHKPGGLDRLAHDAGIFYFDSATYVFCILADGAPNAVCQEYIGNTTFELYNALKQGVQNV